METSSINNTMTQFWKLCKKAQKAWDHNIYGDFELEQDLLPILNLVKANPQYRDAFVKGFIEIIRYDNKGPLEIVMYCMRELQWEEIRMAAIKWMHESEDMRVKMAMSDLLEGYEPPSFSSHAYMNYTEEDRKDHIENWHYQKVMERFKEATKQAQAKAEESQDPHEHEIAFLEIISLIKNCIHHRPAFAQSFILFMQSGQQSLIEITAFCMRDLQWEEVKTAAKKKLGETKDPKMKAAMQEVLAIYEPTWEKSHLYTYYADDD